MKLSDKNKTNNYSLNDTDNFNNELTVSVEEVMSKYAGLLVEYINFILENVKIKKFEYANFIISRGFDTITHVFTYTLYYTRNLDLTYFHCQPHSSDSPKFPNGFFSFFSIYCISIKVYSNIYGFVMRLSIWDSS